MSSVDWSEDSSMLRVTLTDFRRLLIHSVFAHNMETFDIDNYYFNKVQLLQGNQKELPQWTTNQCLLRWEAIGALSPDPTKVLSGELVPSGDFQKNFITGMDSHRDGCVLKVHDWPCVSPLQECHREVLAAHMRVTKLSLSDCLNYIVCLAFQNDRGSVLIYNLRK